MHHGSSAKSLGENNTDRAQSSKTIGGIAQKDHEAYKILAKRRSHSNIVTDIPKSPASANAAIIAAPELGLQGKSALQILLLIESIQGERIKEYRKMEDAFQALLHDQDIRKYHENCAAVTIKFATSSAQLNAIAEHLAENFGSQLPSVPSTITEIQGLEKEKLQVTAQLQVLRFKQRTDGSLDSAVRVQQQRLRQLVDDICDHVEELTLEKYHLSEDPTPALPAPGDSAPATTTPTTASTTNTTITTTPTTAATTTIPITATATAPITATATAPITATATAPITATATAPITATATAPITATATASSSLSSSASTISGLSLSAVSPISSNTV